jgi:hypothetical protein
MKMKEVRLKSKCKLMGEGKHRQLIRNKVTLLKKRTDT